MANECLAPMGALLAIMGGGGAFKQVIVDSGVGPYAGRLLADAHVSPLILAWLVACAMRIAQGSAAVAIITAAGIVAPLVKLLARADCDGAERGRNDPILSQVNDAGFWLVNQSYGMTVAQTLKSWTVMKVITSSAGLALILLVQRFF